MQCVLKDLYDFHLLLLIERLRCRCYLCEYIVTIWGWCDFYTPLAIFYYNFQANSISHGLQFATHALGLLFCSPSPELWYGGRSLSWVPELSPSHSHLTRNALTNSILLAPLHSLKCSPHCGADLQLPTSIVHSRSAVTSRRTKWETIARPTMLCLA
jgi:hypothetical protein